MAISHLKTAPFQGTLFIFFKQETDTARSSFPHYSCKQSISSLFRGDCMAFSGSIKARERPCTRGWRKGKTGGEEREDRESERPKRGKQKEKTERQERKGRDTNKEGRTGKKNWEEEHEKKPGGTGRRDRERPRTEGKERIEEQKKRTRGNWNRKNTGTKQGIYRRRRGEKNEQQWKTKGDALDLFFGGSIFSSHCCYCLRRNEQKKTTGAYNRDRNREGEKLALANQHIFAIVFIIKLQHQANIERDKENKRSKKKKAEGKNISRGKPPWPKPLLLCL